MVAGSRRQRWRRGWILEMFWRWGRQDFLTDLMCEGEKRRGRGREKDGVKKPQSCMRLPMWAESGLSHGHFGEKHLSDWKCVR